MPDYPRDAFAEAVNEAHLVPGPKAGVWMVRAETMFAFIDQDG